MKPAEIDRSGLEPQKYTMQNGQQLYFFVDNHINLVRLDIIFDAGTVFQNKKFQSAAAINLVTEGTTRRSAREIGEFMDYRGIVLEKGNDIVTASLSVYTLSRYLDELLPFLYEIITEASYPQEEFEVYMSKRRQQLLTNNRKTSYVARVCYYERLFGSEHPLGSFATVEDIDSLKVDDVRRFHHEHLQLSNARLVASGAITKEVLKKIDMLTSRFVNSNDQLDYDIVIPSPNPTSAIGFCPIEVQGTVQNTLRVGRLLPMEWNDMHYARFMVLSTILGGYFGSRLMSNIREDKGYTYGVNALTQINRDSIVFYILTDVAADKAEPAMDEIRKELYRLRNEMVSEEELQLVRNCMLGDFVRSIDGVFERAERYVQMKSAGIDETFTDNFMVALDQDGTTVEQLQELAVDILDPDKLLFISAGRIPQ